MDEEQTHHSVYPVSKAFGADVGFRCFFIQAVAVVGTGQEKELGLSFIIAFLFSADNVSFIAWNQGQISSQHLPNTLCTHNSVSRTDKVQISMPYV